MLNIVLFGPPGAGKGTQSQHLMGRYGLSHISTGDILRAQIAAGTELGQKAKGLMDAGVLVPDEVVIGMVEGHVSQRLSGGGFIFDGFPRTVAQARALDEMLSRYGTSITLMIALDVPEPELIRRLLDRGQTSGRPDDADETLIRRRVEEYLTKTAPVAGFYDETSRLVRVDGTGSIETILDEICQHVNRLAPEAGARS